MRAPPFPPDQMPPDVRALHDDMAEIAEHLKGFVSKREDDALVGPFAPMLRFPQFGGSAWAYTKALIENSKLPKPAHELAILVTGAAFDSRYELYAHERVAGQAGLSDAKIAAVAAGQRPADLTEEEQAAYDVAAALTAGKQLPESTYQRALKVFGEDQTAELVYLVAGYGLISMLLNAYDVSVPGREEGLPRG
ncbi:carboxymuconolactone decarboxylase family protein [Lichenihabitans sp. PAMC28606]|uniref:carboxymuconolactone decarboxylase family protein n=1 Tax=Lichenihabitans sp. PAMC28606 TaxID=2880932 RepID=UPI001D09C6D6|nr:carboxymuconolactone decarboxylase family protein [Lichenihabitans sp. PAMC28606]UDL96245.1 carboxymuconolactone decarboxylase family protein [Lichenihabitans sp. PAMC28606]